jgi:hypothetical protein
MMRCALTLHVFTLRSIVHSLEREIPSEMLADGTLDTDTPTLPETVELEALVTVNADVGSD